MGQPGGQVEIKSAARRPSDAPDASVLPANPDIPELPEPIEATKDLHPRIIIEAAKIRIRLGNKGFTEEEREEIAYLLLKKNEPKY